jgi:hypothetical protein
MTITGIAGASTRHSIKVAHITSVFHLDLLSARSFRMALAPLVLSNGDYAGYFRNAGRCSCYTILDNGAYESGGAPVSDRELLEAAQLIAPAEIVCPDVMYDGVATLARTRQFIEILTHEGLLGRFKLMGVAQGKSGEEWTRCFEALNAMEEISTIGMSRLSLESSWASSSAAPRVSCAKAVLPMLADGKVLHLLGGGRSFPRELMLLANEPRVRSADSSFAFKYSLTGVPIAGDILAASADIGPPSLDRDRIDDMKVLGRVKILAELLDACACGMRQPHQRSW